MSNYFFKMDLSQLLFLSFLTFQRTIPVNVSASKIRTLIIRAENQEADLKAPTNY